MEYQESQLFRVKELKNQVQHPQQYQLQKLDYNKAEFYFYLNLLKGQFLENIKLL